MQQPNKRLEVLKTTTNEKDETLRTKRKKTSRKQEENHQGIEIKAEKPLKYKKWEKEKRINKKEDELPLMVIAQLTNIIRVYNSKRSFTLFFF